MHECHAIFHLETVTSLVQCSEHYSDFWQPFCERRQTVTYEFALGHLVAMSSFAARRREVVRTQRNPDGEAHLVGQKDRAIFCVGLMIFE